MMRDSHVDSRRITRRACFLGGAAGLAALPSACSAAQEKPLLDEKELLALVESQRKESGVPALAVAVIRGGKYVFGAVSGVRKEGNKTLATLKDRWHIGSMTKSMTATLCGIYVERGKIDWNTTLAQAFPELRAVMQTEYRNVTLTMLLAHRAGLPSETYPAGYNPWAMPLNIAEPRLEFVRRALQDAPLSPPGTAFLYSNRGYMVAGAMLERVTGELWESLITKEIFTPLGMKSAGFGAAGTPGKTDQPWSHVLQNGKRIAIEPGLHADNAPDLGPAGRVHCSLPDLAKFVCEHLRGERGEKGLLKAETMKFLHTPPDVSDYMAGWIKTARDWGGGPVFWHNGSNTMNYSLMWLAPQRNFAVLTATNFFDGFNGTAPKACDALTAAVVTRLAEAFPKV